MKNISVSSTLLIILSILGYLSNTFIAKNINKIDIKSCSIDFDEVDFCTKERLKDYNNILKNKVLNFNKNKFLMSFKERKKVFVFYCYRFGCKKGFYISSIIKRDVKY